MFQFNINRFWALMVREFYISYLSVIKIIAVLAAALILFLTLFSIGGDGPDEPNIIIINFGILFLIAGFLYASLSFSEFRKDSTRAEYLALPGSYLEKFLTKWLYSNPLYILSISIIFYLLALIFVPIMNSLSGMTFEVGIFASKTYWLLVGLYFILHSIFFAGSITFNKAAIVKTLLVLVLIALAFAILNGIWFRIVWADWFTGLFDFSKLKGGENMRFGVNYRSPDEMPQIRFIIFIFKYLMAPVLWVVSLFKLSDKEV